MTCNFTGTNLPAAMVTRVPPRKDLTSIETFPNPNTGRDYAIRMEIPEFTCLCPKTGQPDFATLYLDYVPDRICVELKSLKLYLFAFRDKGIFYEAVTNAILDDLVAALRPLSITVEGDFNVRGGIASVVRASYERRLRARKRG